MGYRKDKTASLRWGQWVARWRTALVQAGVPHEALESERRWGYFLDHATLSDGKQPHWFSLDRLTLDRLHALHAILEQEYGSMPTPPHLLVAVRSRVRRPLEGGTV